MPQILLGIFIVLHGLVHLLYFGLSRSYFDLDTPLVGWPERSWAFSNILQESVTRSLASVLYVLATILFVFGGSVYLLRVGWWQPVVVIAALVSSAVIILFWDGSLQRLPDKGFVGVLINVVLLGVLFFLERPVTVRLAG